MSATSSMRASGLPAHGTVLDPEVVAQLLARRRRGPFDGLTPREREVLGLMAEGRSNSGIARHLVVSDGAVEKHISSIFAKLGLATSDTEHRRVLAVLQIPAARLVTAARRTHRSPVENDSRFDRAVYAVRSGPWMSLRPQPRSTRSCGRSANGPAG